MKGRKRIPDHLKLVSGTYQAGRSANAGVEVDIAMPDAPAWLSARATKLFEQIGGVVVGMQVMSLGDGFMLAMLASRIEEVEICTAVIEDLGRTYSVEMKAGGMMHRARPEVGMRAEALRHAQALLCEFGLSPAARSKVSPNGDAGTNPFAALDR